MQVSFYFGPRETIKILVEQLTKEEVTELEEMYTNFFYKHNNYKDTYGKKCEKISIILSIMLR